MEKCTIDRMATTKTMGSSKLKKLKQLYGDAPTSTDLDTVVEHLDEMGYKSLGLILRSHEGELVAK